MNVSPQTYEASRAITLISEGYDLLHWGPKDGTYDLIQVSVQLLQTMGSLTDEYSIEHFTDDELTLISETTIACLTTLVDHADNQGDYS